MTGWLLRRSLQAVLTYLVAVSLIFFLMRLVPGDPLARLSDDRPMPPEAIAALRARYGLDQPAGRQFIVFVSSSSAAISAARSSAAAGPSPPS